MEFPSRCSAAARIGGTRPGRVAGLWCMLVWFASSAVGAGPGEATGLDFFEKRIRPVLVEQCYDCHSAEKKKGGLALDHRAGWEQGGDSGAVIVVGKPEESLLIESLRHIDPDLKMPKKAPKLDARVIADFAQWIAMGAPDPREAPVAKTVERQRTWAETLAERRQWWCFQPIANPPPPAVRATEWSAHPVDRFILAKLEEQGLTPAPQADAVTLARRLAFALTGLPATEEQVVAVRNESVGNLADRLLASPAFGERWARHWLDLARYAETYGSEHDYLNPFAWRYRDYVIRAFNDDLPYDRFVQEQIAGDLLAPRWRDGLDEARLGVAWHRMTESYATPVDVKREEVSAIDWQIESLGKSFLGLTITCARCHDHKFDPISAEDFYALYGVFASTRPTLSILDDPARLTARDAELAHLKDQLRGALASRWSADAQAGALGAALQREARDALSPLRILAKADHFSTAWAALRDQAVRPSMAESTFADFTRGDLAGWRVSGPGLPAQPAPAGLLSLAAGERFVRAIQPAGFFSDRISERHGGAIRSPDFILATGAVSVLAGGTGKARLRLVIENFQNDLLLFQGVNPNLETPAPRWVTMRIKEQWRGRRARIEVLTRDDKTCVGAQKDQAAWAKTDGRSSFGIQRVVLHDGDAPVNPSPLPAALWSVEPKSWEDFTAQLARVAQTALAAWQADRASDEDARLLQALLEGGALASQPEMSPEVAALAAKFRAAEDGIPVPTRAPGVWDDGYAFDAEFFPRGDHTKPGPAIPRRFLEVLGGAPLGGADSGRLALARELTRRDNPLVARVMVNRVWQELFGRGLVATPDNFGRMGELPTHPELLDHLATKFVEDGWSVKKLIRYLVASRTWQLAAEPSPRADALDPANALLSHAAVRRLDAEAIRDALLAVGGNLQPEHRGPGVPVFYRTQIDPDKQPPSGPVDGGGCRSVYLETRRLFPSEFLAAFDAPKPNILSGRRSETNVPAQSLALLNDPFVAHQAGLFAARTADAGDDRQRIARLYQFAFTRPPTAAETDRALAFLHAAGDDAWRDFAHALFNLKEFIYLR